MYVLIKDFTSGKPRYHIVIVNVNTIEVLVKIDVTEKNDLLGSFKGGKHFLLNGNFYFQNTVIRLDPTNKKHVVFQKYEDLIPC